MDFLSSLNAEQRKAVEEVYGPVLILAGAGSGKTRVLTHRMAHLISKFGVHPTEILAVTFTNKAAAEMRGRVQSLLRDIGSQHSVFDRDLWVSTFHSICVRILRSDIHYLGYQNTFSIYDDSDQLSVIKMCIKELNLSEQTFSPKAIQSRMNRIKNDGMDPYQYEPSYGGVFEDAFQKVLVRYSDALQKASAVDFADLILLTVKLYENYPKLLSAYQDRFPFVMIDEYQDTNKCQYKLVKLLASKHRNLCAVGDEDQSIYKWRGADITNILNFEKDFPEAKIFKLEQNYRSTKTIIEAASHVISHNTQRRVKELWTENDRGEKIGVTEAYDEHDEAIKLVSHVQASIKEGVSPDEIAVFYRTNAQSRLLEDHLRTKGIAYQIYGGLKFYERLEIKDALCYFRLLVNPKDDASFRRIINVPARGIGAVSIEKLREQAQRQGVSHYELLELAFGPNPSLALEVGRSAKSFKQFFTLVEELRRDKNNLLPSDLLQKLLQDSGYFQSLRDEATIESQSRLENLAELRQSLVEFELRSGGESPEARISLEKFLEEVALVSGADQKKKDEPSLQMMTIHMAKGLEFDHVFVVGLEEELFPNIRPWESEEPSDVEEERRLFYVGLTRAKKKAVLFYAKNRTVFGHSHFRVLSRFVEEIPAEYLTEKKADYFSRRKTPSSAGFFSVDSEDWSQDESPSWESDFDTEKEFRVGTWVVHPLFGRGVVRRAVGRDKLWVEFTGRGVKKISLKFTELKMAD